jgi:hypothetical protein
MLCYVAGNDLQGHTLSYEGEGGGATNYQLCTARCKGRDEEEKINSQSGKVIVRVSERRESWNENETSRVESRERRGHITTMMEQYHFFESTECDPR